MENTYVIKLLPPFYTNVRSEISKMPKIFFEDTGMVNVLKYGFFLRKIGGSLFENALYCLLRSFADRNSIRYWRTKQKVEIDFIVESSSRKLPIEAKLSYPHKAFSNLISFLDKYNEKAAWVISSDNKVPAGRDKRIKCLYPWEIYCRK